MAAAVASIGIMDGAYFVGRGEILHWINATLQLSLAKVEEVRPRSRLPPFGLACSVRFGRVVKV
jgi:hypothetical protein